MAVLREGVTRGERVLHNTDVNYFHTHKPVRHDFN